LASGGSEIQQALGRLDAITRTLRSECPWDREQDERSIVPHTVEEAYELADAAHRRDDAKLLDELGDVLFQVHFLALLLEAHDRINDYFPSSRLFLSVVVDPDAVPTDDVTSKVDTLVLSIATRLDPMEAMAKLDQLDHNWWLDALPQAQRLAHPPRAARRA